MGTHSKTLHRVKSKSIKLYYQNIVKPILFRQDPEDVHDHFTKMGHLLGKFKFTQWITRLAFDYKNPALKQEIAGITFENPVGLSAGFDKDGHFTQILPDVGFGFMQIGSVTANSYGGNPKPRLYRLKKSQALIVYYGLKNDGVKAIIKRLLPLKQRFPLSFSVAKTNCDETADTDAGIKDYCESLKALEKTKLAQLYTINVSCPNTFGGEPFTDPARLEKLLTAIDALKIKKPIFLKMPINAAWKEFDALLQVAIAHGISGVVIGNLQKNYDDPAIKEAIPSHLKGGISGKPCEKLCNNLISKTYKKYGDKLIIVGVGGIFSAKDAYKKIKLGSSLVQLITGMIFEGPQLIGEINRELTTLLEKDGYTNISEAIGADA